MSWRRLRSGRALGLLVLLAAGLHLAGRRFLGPEALNPEVIRIAAALFLGSFLVGQTAAVRALRLARPGETRLPRRVVSVLLDRVPELAGVVLAAVAAWAPLIPTRGPWPVLYGIELVAVFQALAVGFCALSLRLQLDLAGREPSWVPWVRPALVAAAGAYAVAHAVLPVRGPGETLITTLAMAAALVALGLNRLGAMDDGRVDRL